MSTLRTLAPGLSVVEKTGGHSPLGRRMSVIELPGRRLVICSAVSLDEAGMAELDALGEVAYILIPNGFHGSDAPWYAARYPQARVLVPQGTLAKYRPKVRLAGTLEDDWPSDLRDILTMLPLAGLRTHEVVMLHKPSESLLVADLVFNLGNEFRGPARFLLWLNGSLNCFGPSRLLRYVFLKDRAALYASMRPVLAAQFSRIVVCHGANVETGGKALLEQAFRFILGLGDMEMPAGTGATTDQELTADQHPARASAQPSAHPSTQSGHSLPPAPPGFSESAPVAGFDSLLEFRAECPEQAVTVQGLKWMVRDTGGEGPVLVMIPGTLGTSEIYWQQMLALRNAVRIIGVTYPQVADTLRYADGIVALLDQLKVGQFSLQGSSLGGFVAQQVAQRHPARLQTLFIGNSLCDPHSGIRRPRTVAELEATAGADLRKEALERAAAFPESDSGLQLLKRVMSDQGQNRVQPRNLKARMLALLNSEAIGTVNLPDDQIVVIESGDDPIIPPAGQEQVKHKYPGAKMFRFPTGGHFPYVSRPAAYTAILRKGLGL